MMSTLSNIRLYNRRDKKKCYIPPSAFQWIQHYVHSHILVPKSENHVVASKNLCNAEVSSVQKRQHFHVNQNKWWERLLHIKNSIIKITVTHGSLVGPGHVNHSFKQKTENITQISFVLEIIATTKNIISRKISCQNRTSKQLLRRIVAKMAIPWFNWSLQHQHTAITGILAI